MRDARREELLAAFQDLNTTLAKIMPTWRIYRKLVEPILIGAGKSISQIAYLTLLQWRTTERTGLRPLYDICWTAHTKEQLQVLKPEMVVVLGKAAAQVYASFNYPSSYDFIPRRIGDRTVGPEGMMAIQRICERLTSM